jgi:hypothetical protein
LHWAVADDAGFVGSAPGNLLRSDLATNEGEWRLQRIDVPDGFATIKEAGVEVRYATETHLAFFNQSRHLAPRVFNGRSSFVGPVELVKVDTFDPESPQRRIAFAANRFRSQVSLRLLHGIFFVPHKAALGEDEWPVGGGQRAQESANNFFRMPEPVNCGGVNPVDAQIDRVAHGLDGSFVVLRAPSEGPTPAADGPRSKTYGCNFKSGRTKKTFVDLHNCSFMVTVAVINRFCCTCLIAKLR